jgi:hypothetical protein
LIFAIKIQTPIFASMQGKKNYTEKLFTGFQLSERVPQENFYRQLNELLDLSFLYTETKSIMAAKVKKANKFMIGAAIAYNLKKYMCYHAKKQAWWRWD